MVLIVQVNLIGAKLSWNDEGWSDGNVNSQKKRIRSGKEEGLHNELYDYILALKLYKVVTGMYSLICNIHKNNMDNRIR